jgi:hypothetical protein
VWLRFLKKGKVGMDGWIERAAVKRGRGSK